MRMFVTDRPTCIHACKNGATEQNQRGFGALAALKVADAVSKHSPKLGLGRLLDRAQTLSGYQGGVGLYQFKR